MGGWTRLRIPSLPGRLRRRVVFVGIASAERPRVRTEPQTKSSAASPCSVSDTEASTTQQKQPQAKRCALATCMPGSFRWLNSAHAHGRASRTTRPPPGLVGSDARAPPLRRAKQIACCVGNRGVTPRPENEAPQQVQSRHRCVGVQLNLDVAVSLRCRDERYPVVGSLATTRSVARGSRAGFAEKIHYRRDRRLVIWQQQVITTRRMNPHRRSATQHQHRASEGHASLSHRG